MSRVTRGSRKVRRRKKILKLAKGYYGTKSKSFKIAKQAVERSQSFAYRDRRQKKRDFRSLWIVRINAGARENGLSYSRLIHGLKATGCEIDRKILADLAVREPGAFTALAEQAKSALEQTASSDN